MMNEQRSRESNVNIGASISAWLDGELPAGDAKRILDGVVSLPAHSRACEAYWLIGDVLRNKPSVNADLSVDFSRRVMAALQRDPTVLAPAIRQPARESEMPRWMPMAAAVAGVLVVGWMALSISKPVASDQSVADAQNMTTPAVAPAVASARGGFNDDRAYTLAHQAYSSGAALPNVAMYVRTVGAEQVDTGR
ncbi:MAG TPA: sigma-E factor negative regulatory protein [Rhodocyclaceae bacterium]|nr:sigma-E factor negative regulatory protein [Rhodocyclaceae bacterium]